MLQLATRLMVHREVAGVMHCALDQLQRTFPGTIWAILERTGPRNYRATGIVHIAHSDLFELGFWAGGPDVNVSLLNTQDGAMQLGMPRWMATRSTSDQRPELVLAVWSLPGGDVPTEHELTTALSLLSAGRSNAIAYEQLKSERSHDELTGVLNRRGIMHALQHERARAVRYDRELSVLFIDLDKFKSINDNYGHAVGDAALVEVARAVKGILRGSDQMGRFGGDEFLILMPDSDLQAATLAGDRVRKAVSEIVIHVGKHPIGLSVTLGASSLQESTQVDIVELADQRMLEMKRARHQPHVWGDATTHSIEFAPEHRQLKSA